MEYKCSLTISQKCDVNFIIHRFGDQEMELRSLTEAISFLKEDIKTENQKLLGITLSKSIDAHELQFLEEEIRLHELLLMKGTRKGLRSNDKRKLILSKRTNTICHLRLGIWKTS